MMRPCQQAGGGLSYAEPWQPTAPLYGQAAIRHIRNLAQENHDRALPKLQERSLTATGMIIVIFVFIEVTMLHMLEDVTSFILIYVIYIIAYLHLTCICTFIHACMYYYTDPLCFSCFVLDPLAEVWEKWVSPTRTFGWYCLLPRLYCAAFSWRQYIATQGEICWNHSLSH